MALSVCISSSHCGGTGKRGSRQQFFTFTMFAFCHLIDGFVGHVFGMSILNVAVSVNDRCELGSSENNVLSIDRETAV